MTSESSKIGQVYDLARSEESLKVDLLMLLDTRSFGCDSCCDFFRLDLLSGRESLNPRNEISLVITGGELMEEVLSIL